jgi:hypothetical protein
MISKRLLFFTLLLPLLLLSACARHNTAPAPPTPTRWPTATPPPLLPPLWGGTEEGVSYWDGGRFGGEPVVSMEHGISKTAHDQFAACGYTSDHAIANLVEEMLRSASYLNPRTQVIVAQNAQGETLGEVKVTVERLTADLFRVTCSGQRAGTGD